MSKENIPENDEIELDFGKITNIFKSNKDKESATLKEAINDAEKNIQDTEESIEEKESKETDKKKLSQLKKEGSKLEELENELEEEEERLAAIEEEKEDLEKAESKEIKKVQAIDKKVSQIKEKETSEDDEEEDISLDFGTWFGSRKKEAVRTSAKNAKKHDDDEISFDFKEQVSSISGVFKNNSWVLPAVLILIAICFSTFFRMYPAYMPITDTWAQDTVYNYYKSQTTSEINSQYPNLPDVNKQSLITSKFNEFLKANKAQVDQQIAATSQQFKSQFWFTGADGKEHPYLSDIDTYLWYGEAKNYLKNGHFGTALVDGKEVNFLRNGRQGVVMPSIELHTLFEVYLYKIASFFKKDIELMSVIFLVSVIIINLSIFPAFFIGRKISGNVGGFFAAMIVAINAALIGRTSAGVADTDPWNIFFPLMIIWLFLEAFEGKDLKKQILYSALSGLFVGLFSWAWLGWWYPFDFVLAMIGLYVAYLLFLLIIRKERVGEQLKQMLSIGTIFFVVSGICVIVLQGWNVLKQFIDGPLSVITLKAVGISSLWPNVLTTVAEFNAVPISQIAEQMGGSLLFWIGFMGIVLLLSNTKRFNAINILYVVFSGIYYVGVLYLGSKLNEPLVFLSVISVPVILGLLKILYYKEYKEIDIKISVLMIIWFLGTAYGFTKGIRFGILMVPAFAIAFGAALGIAYNMLKNWIPKELKITPSLTSILLIIVFCLLLVGPLQSAHAVARSEVILMNDGWYDSLTGIKNNSTDAIITSWWDFGHWFVAISERRVTSDGADQGERIHWVGKSLLTPDEDTAMGILRMLNCAQEKAPHTLEKYMNGDTVRAIDVLNKIIVVNKEEAKKMLAKEGLSEEAISEVLNLTHCDDLIPQYYIASEDMIGKSGVWAHFGSWDFKKAKMYNLVHDKDDAEGKRILREDFNLSEQDADAIYYEIQNTEGDRWIAAWPSYMSGRGSCSIKGDIAQCTAGNVPLTINLTTIDVTVVGQNNQIFRPNSIVFPDKTEIKEKKFDDTRLGFSVILIPDGNSFYVMLSSPEVANSIFTKLFFYGGHGLEHFRQLSAKRAITGEMIYVYSVNWNSADKFNAYAKPTNEEARASHILIQSKDSFRTRNNRTEEEAQKLVEEVAKKINQTNFAELAKKYSDDPGAANGGELGWFGKGAMVKEFEDAVFSMAVGQVAYPVKTPFGYHIIRLEEKRVVGDTAAPAETTPPKQEDKKPAATTPTPANKTTSQEPAKTAPAASTATPKESVSNNTKEVEIVI